jgi:hypothetical protein
MISPLHIYRDMLYNGYSIFSKASLIVQRPHTARNIEVLEDNIRQHSFIHTFI